MTRTELTTREMSLLAFIAQYADVSLELAQLQKTDLLVRLRKTAARAQEGDWMSPLAIHIACRLLGTPTPAGVAAVNDDQVEEFVEHLRRWQDNNYKMAKLRRGRRSFVTKTKRPLSTPALVLRNQPA